MTNSNDADLRISGYASVFGQTDLGGDSVKAGAFAGSILQLKNGRLPMLFGHETAHPIGVWDRISEDRTIRFIREGAVSGLSIGYRVRRKVASPQGRILTELDLWEVSVVAFPMQRSARITQIGDTQNLLPTRNSTPQRNIA